MISKNRILYFTLQLLPICWCIRFQCNPLDLSMHIYFVFPGTQNHPGQLLLCRGQNAAGSRCYIFIYFPPKLQYCLTRYAHFVKMRTTRRFFPRNILKCRKMPDYMHMKIRGNQIQIHSRRPLYIRRQRYDVSCCSYCRTY